MSKLASQAFLLYLLVLMAALFYFTLGHPMQETFLTLASLALIGLSLAMERLFPLHKDWNSDQGDTAGDVGSFVVIFGLLDGALKWLSPFAILALFGNIGTASTWPLWVQIVAATVLIEFGAWAIHFAHHKYRALWSLHVMHHSTERLYTLNNFRFHPLNHVLNYAAMFVPLLIFGISTEALLAYTALSLPVLLFQHSNIAFDFGVLSHVFNTNTVHRWHHSAVYREVMHNFGRALVLWDHVFGTYHNPDAKAEPAQIGLSQSEALYPRARHVLRQICWPFSANCCRSI